jgi:hypothetical protein
MVRAESAVCLGPRIAIRVGTSLSGCDFVNGHWGKVLGGVDWSDVKTHVGVGAHAEGDG